MKNYKQISTDDPEARKKTMLCHTNVFISKDKQASLSYLVLTCVEYDDAEKKQNLNKGTATILEK